MSGFSMQLVGEKGKKYGLIKPKTEVKKPIIKSIFADDDDDNGAPASQSELMKRQQAALAAQAEKQQQKLQLEDPTVFEYDEVYTHLQSQRTATVAKQKSQETRQPKYMKALLDRAEFRKREAERIEDKVIAKQIEQEKAEYGEKDKFITSAYKEKLKEKQKWAEQMEAQDMMDELDDVAKKGDISGFYAGLLTKNTAVGNERPKPKKKSPTPPPPKAEARSSSPSSSSSDSDSSDSDDGERGGPPKASSASPPRAKRERDPADLVAEDGGRRPASDASPEKKGAALPVPTTSKAVPPVAKEGAAKPPPPTEEERAAKVDSARERFLARKRAKAAGGE